MHPKALPLLLLSVDLNLNLNSESSALANLNSLTFNDFTNSYTPSEPTQNPNHEGGGSNNGGQTNNSPSTATQAPNMPTGGLPKVPASIETVLETAVPASFYQVLENPTSRSSMFSEWHDGNFPTWYQDLPTSVKSWLDKYAASATAGAAGDSGGNGNNGAASFSAGVSVAFIAGAASILSLALML
ncbi:hypothetical protein N7510_004617 [Penicillium lagena]|uniref:uncharacterized protein n=1 Tax=Penicillium lagena TaxID=94218 RepID=UPI00253FA80E|nr:uncharacterized protein N7510_004617 [Penicillium lagena]KAJ5620633.1 hypothetical protein N7510_004617 [Penicillium lagena]